MESIDETDKSILRILQDDAKISMQDLGDKVNLSASACFERVKRLRKDGFILGYSARLDPMRLNCRLLIFVEVYLDRTTPDVFQSFRREIIKRPEILECHMVAGGFDYLLKVRVDDMAEYRDILTTVVLALPGVRETHTYAVLDEVKNTDRLNIR